ncbi:MAG: ABC transporter substrate-binding protein [Saccharofermentanales bacterium]|jgi:iron complex transport system substrate-binding protein
MKRKFVIGLALVTGLLLALCACSAESATKQNTTPVVTQDSVPETKQVTEPFVEPSPSSAMPTSIATEFEPFSLEVMEHEVTYTKVPEKVISLNLHTTENLIALGLEDKIIGTAYTNAEVLPEYADIFNKIPKIAEQYPSWEVLVEADPDFVIGRNSAFGEKGVTAISDFLDSGIMVYVPIETYTPGSTIEATYEDFRNLGRIFNVEEKAEAIINEMQGKVEGVAEKISGNTEKLRVFVYDAGDDQAFTSGQSLESNLIDLAGGENIFNDIEKTWSNVSWEEIVNRNPQVIVINDYGETTAQEKIDFLLAKPGLSEVDAIKNNHFVVLQLPTIFTGIRNGDAVEILAKGFYPDLFK